MTTTIQKIEYPREELFETIKSFYLGLQIGEHEFEPLRDTTKQQAQLMFEEYQKTSQEDSTYEYYMAFTDETLSGFIEFASENEIENICKKYLRVNSVYVDSKFRHQGIATKLLAIAENRARELEYTHVGLGVLHKNNPAINLYKKFGFGEYGLELMKSIE
jgi:ribosomal protein S18 acetylase RimI-like enzyme